YTLRNPEIRTSKRPIDVPPDAPAIVQEMAQVGRSAGVGPMYSFLGGLADHVGRFLVRSGGELTVTCGGDYFIVAKKRQKLTVLRRPEGASSAVVGPPRRAGVGISRTQGGRGEGMAVLANSCMLADAAAAGVQAILPKPDGFRTALDYLKKVPGIYGAGWGRGGA